MPQNNSWIETLMNETLSQFGGGSIKSSAFQKLVIIPETEADYGQFSPKLQNGSLPLAIACFLNIKPLALKAVQGEVHFCRGDEGQAARLSIMEKLSSFREICVLAPGLTLSNAIIQFNDDLPVVRMVLQALMKNIPVKILFAEKPSRAPAILGQKWQTLLNELENMGITLEYIDQSPSEQSAEAASSPGSSPQQKLTPCRSLILEQDIEDMYKKGQTEFRWEKDCIVTPLAVDRAKELGLRIIRIVEGG